MKISKNDRGLRFADFKDGNGVECSIQESSAAEDSFLWLGCNEIGLKKFTPGKSWEDVELEDNHPFGIAYVANNRMHLTREHAAALIPYLEFFAATGSLPDQDPPKKKRSR